MAVGLYSTRQRCNAAGVATRVAVAIISAVAMSALLYYFVPDVGMGRRILLTTACFSIVLCLAVRVVFDRLFNGSPVQAARTRLRCRPARGDPARTASTVRYAWLPDGRFLRRKATRWVPPERTLRRPEDLYSWAREPHRRNRRRDGRPTRDFPMHEFLECRLAGIDIIELPVFLERETGKVRLDVLNPSWIIFGEGFRASQVERWLERGFDLVASSVLLLLGLPLMFAATVAIMIEDGWQAPVLYRQRRVGQHGRVFDVSQVPQHERRRGEHWRHWAVKDDPRVTRVGAIIRKTRIDELPQLSTCCAVT